MDTKSIKFSRTLPARFIAVLLLTALVLVNSFCLAKVARGIILFGSSYITSEQEPVNKTNAFAGAATRLMSNLAWHVAESNENDEAYVAAQKVKLAEEYAESIKTYNEIIADYNACVIETGDGTVPTTSSPAVETTSAPAKETTSVAGSADIAQTVAPLETFQYYETVTGYDAANGGEYQGETLVTLKRGDKGFWYQQFERSGYGTITNFASDHAGNYDSYQEELRNLENGGASLETIDTYLDSVKSARYFVIDKETGNYFTNIAGCTTPEQAKNTLRGSKWYSFFGADGSFESSDKTEYTQNEPYYERNTVPALTLATDHRMRVVNVPVVNGSLLPSSPYYWLDSAKSYSYPNGDYDMFIAVDTKWASGALEDPFVIIEREYSSVSFSKTDVFVALGTWLAYIIVIVYLLAVTGKGAGDEKKKYLVDKIWNDVHFCITFGLCAGCVTLAACFVTYLWEITLYNSSAFAIICSALSAIVVLLITEWLTSVVRHASCGTFWRSTLIAKLLKILWAFIKFCFTPAVNFFKRLFGMKNVKSFPRYTGIAVVGFVAFHLLITGIAVGARSLFFSFIVFLLDCAAISVLLWVIISLDRIMKTVEQAKNGNAQAKTDMNNMFPLFKKFAVNVNSVNDGVQAAVDSALKGQRMKTELITNVSHDLKTPLTSIVSYVDLLKRCDVQDEQAKKYIEILDEKSQRMKKLIEDLVEASKVSSGSVELHPMKLNICELAAQAVGENSELLEQNGIEVRFTPPEEPVFITADGQKTSRIIENLFSNVRKYAMPDTRVYVDIMHDEKFGAMVIKNISRNPIDVPASELTQRFVRGETSRTSEGSGLGLSIAQNLAELQGGKCIVWVDGDLFKVTVFLPIAK